MPTQVAVVPAISDQSLHTRPTHTDTHLHTHLYIDALPCHTPYTHLSPALHTHASLRATLCWVSSTFGLGLAWEVMGCAADDFPVRDGLKVGLHLSCMAKSEKSRHDKARLGFAHGPLWDWGPPHAERA